MKHSWALLLLAGTMMAQEKSQLPTGTISYCTIGEPGCLSFSTPVKASFIMGKLKISSEGEITFPEGAMPSEAAKEFAVWLKRYMQPEPCVSAPPAKEKP